ncbi:unnamed protein product [Echinostoma caproni]|uniref:Histone domain-containing protein n=1 Tax=Echinostoma caproni TaxID=27848 RepID=A0A183B1Z1_9TREM|nr:unnamed protein product [Echinostoma caproni]
MAWGCEAREDDSIRRTRPITLSFRFKQNKAVWKSTILEIDEFYTRHLYKRLRCQQGEADVIDIAIQFLSSVYFDHS